MSESDSLSPLLDRSYASIKDDGDGPCDRIRKFSLICQPVTLLAILAICIIALVYPFWNGSGASISTSSHPFINTEHTALHSLSRNYASKEALSDMVSSLPGLNGDVLSFAQYSGYIDALEGRQLHYWLFEAQSNPDTAPLFLWTNGGPGCSGLVGLLTEHGPFWTVEDDQLYINEYSWNNEVNIVYLEQPYGVGFSTVDVGFEAISGDDAAASDFDAAIRSFITKFPGFASNDIYLSSESFGGHYIPLTALEIMKNNEAGTKPYVNLVGFMVGNPFTNEYENTIGSVEAFYGHGLMRNDIYETWQQYCFSEDVDAMEAALDTSQCTYLYAIGYYEADNTDQYALDFNKCIDDISWKKHKKHLLFHNKFISRTLDRLLNKFQSDTEWDVYTDKTIRPLFKNRNKKTGITRKGKVKLPSRSDILELKMKIDGMYRNKQEKEQERRRLNIEWAYKDTPYYPCAAGLMSDYLNQEDVQQALHVKTTNWGMCNNEVFSGWPEDDWDNQMQPYYAELAAKYPQLKILIFSGDDDSVCGLHGTQYWLDNMGEYGWTVDAENEWIPWQYNNQLAGYMTTYLNKNGDIALYLHTVRTAGHMVPQTQPNRALGLLQKFLYQMK